MDIRQLRGWLLPLFGLLDTAIVSLADALLLRPLP